MRVRRCLKRLIDCPADELLDEEIMSEHVIKRVRLSLHPESIILFYVVIDPMRSRFAGVYHNDVIFWARDRSNTRPKTAGEEIFPGFKAIMRCGGVANES